MDDLDKILNELELEKDIIEEISKIKEEHFKIVKRKNRNDDICAAITFLVAISIVILLYIYIDINVIFGMLICAPLFSIPLIKSGQTEAYKLEINFIKRAEIYIKYLLEDEEKSVEKLLERVPKYLCGSAYHDNMSELIDLDLKKLNKMGVINCEQFNDKENQIGRVDLNDILVNSFAKKSIHLNKRYIMFSFAFLVTLIIVGFSALISTIIFWKHLNVILAIVIIIIAFIITFFSTLFLATWNKEGYKFLKRAPL